MEDILIDVQILLALPWAIISVAPMELSKLRATC